MDNWNTLEKYLVQIGADIDQNSFNSARSALNELKRHISGLKHAAAPLALAAAIGAIGKAAYDTIKSVAQADMEYKKLAASMWVTKETAKALSVAMKTMGVTQEDLAWVPELREQFFRLRAEMQKFATPADADAQLRYIRDIGYDVQVLFVRLKMLKEWIAYYLIQYLEPYIEDFRAFINWLLEKVGTDLPGLARKVAHAMAMVLRPALATLKVLGSLVSNIYDFIEKLPEEVKGWITVFAVVGAAIMAGPFGGILMALSAAMILLEDFLGYMNGWESSETLAPLWEALLNFAKGEGSGWMTQIKNFLTETGRLLSNITKLTIDLVKELKKSVPGVEEFGQALLDAVKLPFHYMKMLGDLFVTILKAINLLLEGKKREAWDALVEGVKKTDFTPAAAREAAKRGEKMAAGGMSLPGVSAAVEAGAGIGKTIKRALGFEENPSDLAREAWEEAQRIGKDLNVDPSLIYGQWYHETGGFTSRLAREDYNFGGLTTTKDMGPAYKQPDGSLWYMSFNSIRDYADYYKRVWGNDIRGAGSAEEYAANLKREGYYGDSYENYVAGMYGGMQHIPATVQEGVDDQTIYSGVDSLPDKSYGSDVAAGFMSGSNEMAMDIPGLKEAMGGFAGVGGATFNMGAPTVNINVAGTNASAEEIAGAVKDGLTGLGDYMLNIQARQMRRATI